MKRTLGGLLLLLTTQLIAEDWPQFRGPGGQGISAETGLPVEWGDTQNVRWKTTIPGRGWSSPSIQGDRIWLTTATEDGRSLRLLTIDRDSGRILRNLELFRLEGDIPIHEKNSHASPTPIIDGDRVYVHFGGHGTACVKTNGEVLWKTKLIYYHRHGPGGSPIIYGNLLIVNCDGYDIQYVAGLDKMTGEMRWRKRRAGYQAYTTPLVIRAAGRDQLISIGAMYAASYEPETGDEIWRVRYGKGYSNVPRPVFGHGLVYLTTGFDQADLLAIKPDGQGDITDSHIAWRNRKGIPLTSSPLLVGDEIYFVSDNGIAACLDARTGKEHWRTRFGGNYSASPIYADGRIYFLSEECDAPVIAPGKELKRLATNKLDGRCLASIAPAGKSLFLRTDTTLYRFQQPGAGAPSSGSSK